jgi:Zn-dependent protease
MFLGEPQPSQYDWRFQIFGFPTRVTWLFWAVSAALGYTAALNIQTAYARIGIPSQLAVLLAIWVGAAFISILIHELGHALAFRYYGVQCEIVLYQMGGLAIPGAGLLWGNRGKRSQLSHLNQIVISAAGPAIQIVFAGIIGVTSMLCGVYVYEFEWLATLLQINTSSPSNPMTHAAIQFSMWIGIWWALINLLPIFPLDGGQIARHLIGIVRRTNGLLEAYMLGAIVGALAAIWFYSRGSTLNALFFASMAVNNFQAMQQANGPRIW